MQVKSIDVVITLADGRAVNATLNCDGWQQYGADTPTLGSTVELTTALFQAACEAAEWEA